MPLAFSTLGCPTASLDSVLELAQRFSIAGLELRSGPSGIVSVQSSIDDRVDIRQKLAAADVSPLTVSSYIRVIDLGSENNTPSDAAAEIALASDLGAYGVRVFPGGTTETSKASTQPANAGELTDAQRLGANLSTLAGMARESGVKILLETHDSYCRGADIASVLEAYLSDEERTRVEVIWDVAHTWRAGESPEATFRALANHLAYVQLKDLDTHGALVLPGDGVLDLAGVVKLVGADAWYSLEWEAAWHPELPPLSEALTALSSLHLFDDAHT